MPGRVRRPSRVGSTRSALFLDLGGLAAQVAQVVELGAANVAAGEHVDAVDVGRVHGERALDTHAERHLADGEGLTDAAALAPDHHAPEDLDTLLGALDDLDVHVKRVAGPKFGDVVAEGLAVDKVESVHEGPGVSGVRTEEPVAHLSGVDRLVPHISATSPGRARRPQESTRSVCHSGNAATKSSCPGAPALLGQHLEVTRPQLDVVEEVGASPGGPS